MKATPIENKQRTIQQVVDDPEQLRPLNRKELKDLWQTHFPRKKIPPTPALLLHELAFEAQAKIQGGLNSETQKLIKQLMRTSTEPNQNNLSKSIKPPQLPTTSKFKSGTRLIRHWQGHDYEVIVKDKQYYYHDKPYRSLTKIAKLITGTHWSGPRFFGVHNVQTGS